MTRDELRANIAETGAAKLTEYSDDMRRSFIRLSTNILKVLFQLDKATPLTDGTPRGMAISRWVLTDFMASPNDGRELPTASFMVQKPDSTEKLRVHVPVGDKQPETMEEIRAIPVPSAVFIERETPVGTEGEVQISRVAVTEGRVYWYERAVDAPDAYGVDRIESESIEQGMVVDTRLPTVSQAYEDVVNWGPSYQRVLNSDVGSIQDL